MVKSYEEKIVVSGNVIEVYSYQEPVFFGFEKYVSGGIKQVNEKIIVDYKSIEADTISLAEVEILDFNKNAAKYEDDVGLRDVNRQKSFNRARKELRRLINCNLEPCSKFLTLTFAENIQDLDKANNEFKKFIKRFNYYYKIKLKYSVVIEFQKRGAIHYHAILYNLVQKIKPKDVERLWKNGFVKINKIDNVDNVGAYICKYMTKTNDDRLRSRKMYFCSKGLEKPKIIREPDLIKILANFLSNKTPKYEDVFSNDYNTVKYKQYVLTSDQQIKSSEFIC